MEFLGKNSRVTSLASRKTTSTTVASGTDRVVGSGTLRLLDPVSEMVVEMVVQGSLVAVVLETVQ